MAEYHLTRLQQRRHGVRDQLVRRPVSTADHIAGARTREPDAVLCEARQREKGIAIRLPDQFRTGLAVGIRIAPAKGIGFQIAPFQAPVLIALVARDVDHRARAAQASNGFDQVDRAHDIGRIRLDGILVRTQNDRLRRHVKDDLRLKAVHSIDESFEVTHITEGGVDQLIDARKLKEAGLRGRLQRVTGDSCTKGVEQQTKPSALESSMTCNQYALAMAGPKAAQPCWQLWWLRRCRSWQHS